LWVNDFLTNFHIYCKILTKFVISNLHVMFCEYWHCVSFLHKTLHVGYACTGKMYGIIKVDIALVRSVYCISFILQVINLPQGLTQLCAY
jgi:hypothetical protein